MIAPSRYEVEAVSLGAGRSAADCLGERIVFDSVAEEGPLPCPSHLLVASFAACMLQTLERSAAYLRFRYRHASIRVTAESGDAPPRFRRIEYELRLDTDEPPGRVDLLHRYLVRSGAVTATLAAACTVEGTVAVTAPAA